MEACLAEDEIAGILQESQHILDAREEISTKLTIGAQIDTFEPEADQAAEQVMHMPEPAAWPSE